MSKYDENNIFAKILRGEIPSSKVYEDDKILAFHDIYPMASTHVLVIPKGNYINLEDFTQNAPSEVISHYFKKVAEIAKLLNLDDNFRILANTGEKSGQTIFHFHTHIMSEKHT